MELSDEEILSLACYGYNIDEIASGDYKVKKIDNTRCNSCGGDIIHPEHGVNTCSKCGITEYGFVQEWVDNIWMLKKSVHKRNRWFHNKVKDILPSRDTDTITDDFIEVVNVMKRGGLLKGRNMSRYHYYIIRLASRRGFKLMENVKDMRDSKIRSSFDDRLFGSIYKTLGWDKNCNCPYYIKWIERKVVSSK